jgi:hypothetical protein
MIRHLIIILPLLFAACGQNSQSVDNASAESKSTYSDSLQAFSITKATAIDFNDSKKTFIDKILYDTIIFKNVKGEIKLPVAQKWKPYVIFTDTLLNTDNSDVRQYDYVGQFDKIGFYIVSGSFWEYSEYYLIDKKTGRQTTLWSSPTISPNDKFIANLSMTYGFEGVPNGIQVWRIDRNEHNEAEPVSLSKQLELDQQIWAPDDFVWETDNSIILKVAAVDKYMNETGQPNPNDFYYLRLKFQ